MIQEGDYLCPLGSRQNGAIGVHRFIFWDGAVREVRTPKGSSRWITSRESSG
jgi:hypothetical protein